jgi:hypothetical protein
MVAVAAQEPSEAAASPAPGGSEVPGSSYLDDRSTPQAVLLSLYNAINRKEYVRAYSYWEPNAVGLVSYDQFEQGYANTQSVELTVGPVTGDAGAGQFYATVPVIVKVRNTDSSTSTFVGCYVTHLANPGIQAEPPFHPMGIQKATIREVAQIADTTRLMLESCNSQ